MEEKDPEFSVDEQGTLWYKKCLCVPKVKEIKKLILRCNTPYYGNPNESH
jgi:hypothetical protein